MKPVAQTKLYGKDGIQNGNFFSACLASMLELPLWMVPPFEDMFGRDDWRVRVNEWLATVHKLAMVRKAGHPVDQLPEFYIANGMSPRGVYSRGKLAHDPHYSGAGIADVEWCWSLLPVDPENSST
jgi:hypothetical protein